MFPRKIISISYVSKTLFIQIKFILMKKVIQNANIINCSFKKKGNKKLFLF